VDKSTGGIDRADICLSQWIERGKGYHTEVWDQWVADTHDALRAHRIQRARMRRLVRDAAFALIDHQVEIVASKLNELAELLK